MALQEFAWADSDSNLGKAVKNSYFIKFKLISGAKSTTFMWHSHKYCNPAIGGILVGGDNSPLIMFTR